MGGEDIDMGVEDVNTEGSNPISKLHEYIPPHRGNAKVPKDTDESKVMIHTPLLLNKITFKGPRLAYIPHIKLEGWDLAYTKRFPHLATDQFMRCVFYKDIGVTMLEIRKWIKGVDKARLLNML